MHADVAQPEEQRFRKPQVKGSNPFIGSTISITVVALLGAVSISGVSDEFRPFCWTFAGQIPSTGQHRALLHTTKRQPRPVGDRGAVLFRVRWNEQCNCSELGRSWGFLTPHGEAAKYETFRVIQPDPLKREQLPSNQGHSIIRFGFAANGGSQ